MECQGLVEKPEGHIWREEVSENILQFPTCTGYLGHTCRGWV